MDGRARDIVEMAKTMDGMSSYPAPTPLHTTEGNAISL